MKFFVTIIFICIYGVIADDDLSAGFRSFELIPDILTVAPKDLLTVKFKDTSVEFGKELTPTQVNDIPSVTWKFDDSSLYTICMIDPDTPSREEPIYREFLHWLVVNVPGNDVNKGDTLWAYVTSGPPDGTGLHRYVYLVYDQPHKIDVSNFKRIGNNTKEGRPNFYITKFADQHNFGVPIAGNMYQAQYDDYVPMVHEHLDKT